MEVFLKRIISKPTFSDFEQIANNQEEFWKNIALIKKEAFQLTLIKELNISNPNMTIESAAFSYCFMLEKAKIATSDLGERLFDSCEKLETAELTNAIEIPECMFTDCTSLKNFKFAPSVREIRKYAFMNCKSLEYLEIPSTVKIFNSYAFANCPFNYFAKKKDATIILSKNPIEKTQDISSVVDFSVCKTAFLGFDITSYMPNEIEKLEADVNFAKLLKKQKVYIPCEFLNLLNLEQKIQFVNSNFKFFKQIESLFLDGKKLIADNYLISGLILFAYNIGCFSKNEKLAQTATEWLKESLRKGDIFLFEMSVFNSEMDPHLGFFGENTEFSKFLFGIDEKTQKSNLWLLRNRIVRMDKKAGLQEYLSLIYREFKQPNAAFENIRWVRDEKGNFKFKVVQKSQNPRNSEISKVKKLSPTVDLFLEYFKTRPLNIENEQDQAIASEIIKWQGYGETQFLVAKKIMQEFEDRKTPKNIVGSHLTDRIQTYIKRTDEISKQTRSLAANIVSGLSKIVKSQFTYDWLEKDSALNLCLGLYCESCAHLTGQGFGIAHASIVDPNVQNLAIFKGDQPIAKSTIYVNREEGYAVCNNVHALFKYENNAELFKCFMKAINHFATEYNKQNPNAPLKKINIGMSLNALGDQIEVNCKQGEVLDGYHFEKMGAHGLDYAGNWQHEQYTIWELTPSNKEVQGEQNRVL